MLIQSSHPDSARGLDAYFTPPEATRSLIQIEQPSLSRQHTIWEPACGDGAISQILTQSGFSVISSDIAAYTPRDPSLQPSQANYLTTPKPDSVSALITNPPFKLALDFALKALTIDHVRYLALLLRTNFLESTSRLSLFRSRPPSRVWISSRRLPMMHRHGWDGPVAPSNTCHAWFIWEQGSPDQSRLCWFDWAEHNPDSARINSDKSLAELDL